MSETSPNYMSPKVELRSFPEKGGYGIFARESFKKDEVIIVWGGLIVDGETLLNLPEYKRIHSIQVEEDLFEAPLTDNDPADRVNHSCDPNAGISGQITLVAMRDIQAGEEICFDYAMSDSNPYDEFECRCGTTLCRGQVCGDDWRLPELQQRYKGYFSNYLQRRIEQSK